MTTKERITWQRCMANEALGKLKAATELFGAESERSPTGPQDYETWRAKIEEIERWIFEESPIA